MERCYHVKQLFLKKTLRDEFIKFGGLSLLAQWLEPNWDECFTTRMLIFVESVMHRVPEELAGHITQEVREWEHGVNVLEDLGAGDLQPGLPNYLPIWKLNLQTSKHRAAGCPTGGYNLVLESFPIETFSTRIIYFLGLKHTKMF